MIVNNIFRSRMTVGGILAAFVLLVFPVAEFAQVGAPAAGGSLVGFVFDTDMKTPVPNAVVKLRNVAKAKEFESAPSDTNGMYKITGVPAGRYILGISSAKGDFNFDYALVIKGKETAKLSVALQSGGQTSGVDAKKKSFFTSPMGIVTIVVVAGAVLYTVFKSDEEEASPVLR